MKTIYLFWALVVVLVVVSDLGIAEPSGAELSIATFDVDVTPPIGSDMAYDPVVNTWDMSLRARGIVLLGAGEPIVLCAIDWIGIGNEGHDAFRDGLAAGAGTVRSRVALHAVHQHDAPGCDFTAEAIAASYGLDPKRYESAFAREVIARLTDAVRDAVVNAQVLTHVSAGVATVEEVASNRRIYDAEGKVRAMRFTSCGDPELRAEPEGVIDPEVSVISFWSDARPVAVLSYYACHPQSYYRTGLPNPDFPGVARFLRQMEVPDAVHVHFTGAGGNIGAGKYNDGSKKNRMMLAQRLAEGMRKAWETAERVPVTPDQVQWKVVPTALPVAPWLVQEEIEASLKDQPDPASILGSATSLAWIQRCASGHKIDISCLALGGVCILHFPGELFVEYQLAAKAARPDLRVAMAAYGDYGMGYIGTEAAYEEGGYETSERASKVAPSVEGVLMAAIRELLDVSK